MGGSFFIQVLATAIGVSKSMSTFCAAAERSVLNSLVTRILFFQSWSEVISLGPLVTRTLVFQFLPRLVFRLPTDLLSCICKTSRPRQLSFQAGEAADLQSLETEAPFLELAGNCGERGLLSPAENLPRLGELL